MLPRTLNLEQQPWHSLHKLCKCLDFPFLLTSVIPKQPRLVHSKQYSSQSEGKQLLLLPIFLQQQQMRMKQLHSLIRFGLYLSSFVRKSLPKLAGRTNCVDNQSGYCTYSETERQAVSDMERMVFTAREAAGIVQLNKAAFRSFPCNLEL